MLEQGLKKHVWLSYEQGVIVFIRPNNPPVLCYAAVYNSETSQTSEQQITDCHFSGMLLTQLLL